MKTLKLLSIIVATLLFTACGSKDKGMEKLFSSEQSLRDGIKDKAMASEDNNCFINFLDDKTAKVFVKESGDPGFTQFKFYDYRITYLDGELCVEFPRNENHDHAYAILTQDELILDYKSKKYKFKNIRIITQSEAEKIYGEGGGQTNSMKE